MICPCCKESWTPGEWNDRAFSLAEIMRLFHSQNERVCNDVNCISSQRRQKESGEILILKQVAA